MSAERATYLDSSAIVKLVVEEPESSALRCYLRRKGVLVTSALARTEVARALLPFGMPAAQRGTDVMKRLDVIRLTDRILRVAGTLQPPTLRSLDAIHLATAQLLGDDLGKICTYDDRMAAVAKDLGHKVIAPT